MILRLDSEDARTVEAGKACSDSHVGDRPSVIPVAVAHTVSHTNYPRAHLAELMHCNAIAGA
jgi:hypothetical protein